MSSLNACPPSTTSGTPATRKRKMVDPDHEEDAAAAAAPPAQVMALTVPAIGLVSCENGDSCRHAYTWDHPEVFSFSIDAETVSTRAGKPLLQASRAFRTESFKMAGARFVVEVDVDARPLSKETSGSRVAVHMISPASDLPSGQCFRVQLVCKRRPCEEEPPSAEECSCHAHTTRWAASGRWIVSATQTKFTFDVGSFLSSKQAAQRYGHPVRARDKDKDKAECKDKGKGNDVQVRFEVVVLAGDACREVDVCSEYELLQAHEHAAGYACLATHPPRRLESFGMFFEPRHSFLICDDWDTQTVLREVRSSMALHHRELDLAARLRAKRKQKKQKQRARKQQQDKAAGDHRADPHPDTAPSVALSPATRPTRTVVRKHQKAFVPSPEVWMVNRATNATAPAQFLPTSPDLSIGRVWAPSELAIEPPVMFLRESNPLDDAPLLASALIHIKWFDPQKKTVVYIGSLSVQSLEPETLWLRLTQFVAWKQTGRLPVAPNRSDASLQARMPSRSVHWVKERCCFEETHLLTSGDTLIGFAMPDDPAEVLKTHQPLLTTLLRRASVRHSITRWSVTEAQSCDRACYRELEGLDVRSQASAPSSSAAAAKRSHANPVADFKSSSCCAKAPLSKPIAALRSLVASAFEGFLQSVTSSTRATELMALLKQPFRPSLVQGLRADDDSDEEGESDVGRECSASEQGDGDGYSSASNASGDAADDSYDSLATTVQPSEDALSTAGTEELPAEAPLSLPNEDTSWIDELAAAPATQAPKPRRRKQKQKKQRRGKSKAAAAATAAAEAPSSKEEEEEAEPLDAVADVDADAGWGDDDEEELLPICREVDLSFPRALPLPPVQLIAYEPEIKTAAPKARHRDPPAAAWSGGCILRVASAELLRCMIEQRLVGVRSDQRELLDVHGSDGAAGQAPGQFAVFLYAPPSSDWVEGMREGVLLGPFELDRSTLQLHRRHEAGAFPPSLVPPGFTLPVQCKVRPVDDGNVYWDLTESRWRDALPSRERHRALDVKSVQELAELLRRRGRVITPPKQLLPPSQAHRRPLPLPLPCPPAPSVERASPLLVSVAVAVTGNLADQVPQPQRKGPVPPVPLLERAATPAPVVADAGLSSLPEDDAVIVIAQDLSEINRRRFFFFASSVL
jgi:hypothetical protein